jgi:hypothetical protein
LNHRWWLPPARLAELAQSPREKEALLTEACKKNPRLASLWETLAELQSKEGKGVSAQNSWIKAEDAAASPEERARVHQEREKNESERLDAAAAAKRAEADAAKAEDERLKNEHLSRIRTAEERANEANGGAPAQTAQAEPPNGVVPWWNPGERPLEANLIRVDCIEQHARLWLKPASGKTLALLVDDPSKVSLDGPKAQLGCGVQQPARKVSLTYKARLDKTLGTSGDILAIHFE